MIMVTEITRRFTYVGLHDMTLSADELRTVSMQTPLRKLYVMNSRLELSAIDQLGSLRNLWWIDASGSNLNDSAFEFLTTLPSLTEIDVSNTEVSAEAVQRAKRRNPRLMVHH